MQVKFTNYQEKCSDCICLCEKNGQWYCDEMQQYCRFIDKCIEDEQNTKEIEKSVDK